MPPKRNRSKDSLACLIQALQGTRVVVELRHDTIVRGVLADADEEMNLTMEGVTYEPLQGDKQTMDFLHLRARMVRYIHLPGTLDPAAAIEAHRRAAAEALATHRREALAAQQLAGPLPKGAGEANDDGGVSKQDLSSDHAQAASVGFEASHDMQTSP